LPLKTPLPEVFVFFSEKLSSGSCLFGRSSAVYRLFRSVLFV